MDDKDYYTSSDGTKYDIYFEHSTMSNDGRVVAFDGNRYFDSTSHRVLLIHDFESTAKPVEVTLPDYVGNFNLNAGLISNADGTRIFFNADDTAGSSHHLFGMVNGKTGEVTILLRTSSVEVPQDIGTDAAGNYLYFNESNDAHGKKGNLYRIAAHSGATLSEVIDAASVPHPSGGTVKFIDNFDVSDDGQTIVFVGRGRDNPDGSTGGEDELFIKTTSGIRNLTNTQNIKSGLVISGNASTIVYTEDQKWMVTTPSAAAGEERQIETDYRSCSSRPGITQDGSTILGRSTYKGTSSCNAYLIQTDGHSRLMVEPSQIRFKTTRNARLHLSDDGKRTFFLHEWSLYQYNMTAGVFSPNLWPAEVPSVTDVSYPNDMYTKLENDENTEVKIIVHDQQGDITEDEQVKVYNLLPSGYIYPDSSTESEDASVYVAIWGYTDNTLNTFYRNIGKGPAWPAKTLVMTARFSVRDDDFNVGYVDTLIQPPNIITPAINYLLFD
jgi:hypothetical protein